VILRSLRVYSLPASVMPVGLGACVALREVTDAAWWLLPFVAVSVVCVHLGANVVNDIMDYRRGIDSDRYRGSSGVASRGLLTTDQMVLEAAVLYVAGTAAGLVVTVQAGPAALALGLVGMIGSYAYTGGPIAYKYRALGEPAVFILMGPLLVAGTARALSGVWSIGALVLSIPVGLLVTAILLANNLRDMSHDAACGIDTLAIRLGFHRSATVLVGLIFVSYGIVGVSMALGTLPPESGVVFLTLVAAVPMVKQVVWSNEGGSRALRTIDRKLAALHGLFGSTLCGSLIYVHVSGGRV